MRTFVLSAFLLLLGNPLRAEDPDAEAGLEDVSADEKLELERATEELADIHERIRKGDLPRILFDFDSWDVNSESGPTLDLIAALLRRNPRIKLLITAHTDSIGSERYNIYLSGKRAKAVKGELVKRGVPPPSIRFRGKGFSQPIADNNTEAGREKNRRVEFKLLSRWWSSVY
ncbi:MAG: OmpA family protein [Elusimicrobia bacterium]|nr:OmpA family protein [Elusimicrobiota bacterium]